MSCTLELIYNQTRSELNPLPLLWIDKSVSSPERSCESLVTLTAVDQTETSTRDRVVLLPDGRVASWVGPCVRILSDGSFWSYELYSDDDHRFWPSSSDATHWNALARRVTEVTKLWRTRPTSVAKHPRRSTQAFTTPTCLTQAFTTPTRSLPDATAARVIASSLTVRERASGAVLCREAATGHADRRTRSLESTSVCGVCVCVRSQARGSGHSLDALDSVALLKK